MRKTLTDSSIASEEKVALAVVILTRNEEKNVGDCLRSLAWAPEIFVVDSESTDRTREIAAKLGAQVFVHPFDGYARQRNWALEHLPFSNEWVLMLDADERVPTALAAEISEVVRTDGNGHTGFHLRRRIVFLRRWLKHGGLYPTWILRLFKRQCVRFEERPLNEHAILSGTAGHLDSPFDHCDNRSLSDWIAKHNRYSDLEADEYLQETLWGGYSTAMPPRWRGSQAERKRWIKLRLWNLFPLLLRPFLFFFRSYVLKRGFLDGQAGFVYHVLWGFCHQFLISAKIIERNGAVEPCPMNELVLTAARERANSAHTSVVLGLRHPEDRLSDAGEQIEMTPTKAAVQHYWDSKPCGSKETAAQVAAADFFQAHSDLRYSREPEILPFARFDTWGGRRVLEIGVGMGADFVRFGEAKAIVFGIDLSPRSLQLAAQNAQIHRIPPNLMHADAESLPFADESFDLVYSWGVLHHVPNTDRALSEVYRVLKPNGECRVMLYHRNSLLGLQCYVRYGLARLKPFARVADLIATHVESPGTKAYSLSEAKSLFVRFNSVTVQPVVTTYDLRLGRRRFAPRWMLRLIPSRLGWFLLIQARK